MKAGIVGFEGVGKRTLFALLTQVAGAASSRTEQVGVLRVPDLKLSTLSRLHESRKTTPATVEFVLIPGLVKGRSKEKLDVASLRAVAVLVHAVPPFEEPSGPHPESVASDANDARALDLAEKPGLAVAYVSARIESEIAELSPEEAKAFRKELGLSEGMVGRVGRAAFDLVGVI